MDEQLQEVLAAMQQGTRRSGLFFAPGRVNLIGEHLDYNGGHVLPTALQLGTYVVGCQVKEPVLHLFSMQYRDKGAISVPIERLEYVAAHGWANYPKGVVQVLHASHQLEGGIALAFSGDLPIGCGLASSAAIELATALAVNGLYELEIEPLELAKLCQRAETEHIGVECGIMDQFVAAMAVEGAGLLIDCGSLSYQHVPLELPGAVFVVSNSSKARDLAHSSYNQRKDTCQRALEALRLRYDIGSLVELEPAQLDSSRRLIDATQARRVEHVVLEERRTLAAVDSLRRGDVQEFGSLMNHSHASLRDLYEVTGPYLDALVEEAWKHPATIGARMTGAGFGGCTVNLVQRDGLQSFVNFVGQAYTERTGLQCDFYPVHASAGGRELCLEEGKR